MPSNALKRFKQLWSNACKSMWIEIAALRHLDSAIRAQYASLSKSAVLTDWIYAPECVDRIDDTTKDFMLNSLPELISGTAASRVVLLSAGFEAYFEDFIDQYLLARSKYSHSGTLTPDGNKVKGEVMKCRGPTARIDAFAEWTSARITSLKDCRQALDDVYLLRNAMAHDAGIIDSGTAQRVKLVPVVLGKPLRLDPEQLASVLAPPVILAAELLDAKIRPT